MSIRNPSQRWKQDVLFKPRVRESFQRMHLGVLHQATRQQEGDGLLFIRFEIGDFVLCEVKGQAADLSNIGLPSLDGGILWLCVQFFGKLTFSSGRVSEPGSVFCFSSPGHGLSLTLPAEKTWMLFLGVSGASRQQLLSEYPELRPYDDPAPDKKRVAPYVPIGHVERQILELFSRKTFGPFSTLHQLGLLLGNLYTAYMRQLKTHPEAGREEPLFLLYHKALDYVQAHYMEADLTRARVAEALHCSTRNLSRAFEGRSVTLNAMILRLRLHKARELLRDQPDRTVEYIAGMLHFTNAKHFATQYKNYFHRSPREDRKKISNQ